MNTMHPQRNRIAPIVALSLLLGACSTLPAFSTRYADNQGQDMANMLSRIKAAPAAEQLPIAVGVSTKPAGIYAFEISTRKVLWKQPAKLAATPIVTADAVLTEEGGQVVVRELRDGSTRFSVPLDDTRLNGAGGDAAGLAITLTRGMGTFARTRLLFVVGDSVRWEHTIPAQAGVPTVAGSVVLVPWSHQFMSALEADSGDELARVRVADGVISHVWRDLGGVFAGSQHGVTKVDSAFSSGRFKTEGFVAAPKQRLPGRPKLLRDVYDNAPIPAPESAQHSIRLEWRAAHQGAGTQLQDGLLYLVFYRFVFALEAKDLSLRWIHTGEADLVGAGAQAGGLLVADRTGRISMLSATGGQVLWSDASAPASSVLVVPRAFETVSSGGEGPDAASVRSQLLGAAQDRDSRLVPIRLLAVKLLGGHEDAEATAHLLALCEDGSTAPMVKSAACKALGKRKTGSDHLLTALQRHYSWLDGTQAPPVGTLAKAAGNLGEKGAVGMLIAHLNDPNTPSKDLQDVVLAVEKLGDASAAEPLSDFLAMYHADVIDEHLGTTLEMIPHTLVILQGPAAKERLEQIANDNMCAFGVREKARIELEKLAEAAAAKAKAEEAPAEGEAEDKPTDKKPEPVVDETPRHVDTAVVRKVLLPVRDKLQTCLTGGAKKYFQARIVLVVEDGALLMVSVLPKELQDCIEPLVSSVTYPTTKLSRRDTVNYILKRQ